MNKTDGPRGRPETQHAMTECCQNETKCKDGNREKKSCLFVYESVLVRLCVCVCLGARADTGRATELAALLALTPPPHSVSALIRWGFLQRSASSPARDKDRLTDVPLISGPTSSLSTP